MISNLNLSTAFFYCHPSTLKHMTLSFSYYKIYIYRVCMMRLLHCKYNFYLLLFWWIIFQIFYKHIWSLFFFHRKIQSTSKKSAIKTCTDLHNGWKKLQIAQKDTHSGAMNLNNSYLHWGGYVLSAFCLFVGRMLVYL